MLGRKRRVAQGDRARAEGGGTKLGRVAFPPRALLQTQLGCGDHWSQARIVGLHAGISLPSARPAKAKVLNDRHSKAYLRDEATGTVLSVPAMENVGELRTGAAPQADRTYFMIFGNPGRLVKSGSRVTVVAGNLHVDGLIVD